MHTTGLFLLPPINSVSAIPCSLLTAGIVGLRPRLWIASRTRFSSPFYRSRLLPTIPSGSFSRRVFPRSLIKPYSHTSSASSILLSTNLLAGALSSHMSHITTPPYLRTGRRWYHSVGPLTGEDLTGRRCYHSVGPLTGEDLHPRHSPHPFCRPVACSLYPHLHTPTQCPPVRCTLSHYSSSLAHPYLHSAQPNTLLILLPLLTMPFPLSTPWQPLSTPPQHAPSALPEHTLIYV